MIQGRGSVNRSADLLSPAFYTGTALIDVDNFNRMTAIDIYLYDDIEFFCVVRGILPPRNCPPIVRWPFYSYCIILLFLNNFVLFH